MKPTIRARDIMSHPVKRLLLDTTVRDAAAFMLRMGISGAPVVDGRGRPMGVFTLSDLARHVQERIVHVPEIDPMRDRVRETGEYVPTGLGYHFESLEDARVSEFMTPGLVSVPPDAPIGEIANTLTSLRIHRVFVQSEKGEIEGVITTMDVLKWLSGWLAGARQKDPV